MAERGRALQAAAGVQAPAGNQAGSDVLRGPKVEGGGQRKTNQGRVSRTFVLNFGGKEFLKCGSGVLFFQPVLK